MRASFGGSIFLLLVIVLLPLSISFVAGTSYISGVKAGDVVSYVVNSSNTGARDPAVAPFLTASSIDLTVTDVNGPDISVSQLWRFTNGTEDRAIVISGNVASGAGNQTVFGGVRWFIGGGLNIGDHLFQTSAANTSLTGTVHASYAGALRMVNIWNKTYTSSSFTEVESHVWDKNTGLLLERTYQLSSPGFQQGYLDVKAVQTSVSFPDFTLSVEPSTLNVTADTEGTMIIRLSGLYGFNATVQLEVVSSPGLTCGLGHASLRVSMIATSTLKCKALPGSYIAKVNAAAGTLLHITQVTFHSVALSPQRVSASGADPIGLYATIGAGLAAVAFTGFLVLRKKASESQPCGRQRGR